MPTINQLKEEIVSLAKITIAELELLTKKELETRLIELKSYSNVIDTAKPIENLNPQLIMNNDVEIMPTEKTKKKKRALDDFLGTFDDESSPDINDKDWTGYVLSLLDKDDKDESGNPKTDSLKRIAHQIFGNFSIISHVLEYPGISGRATVTVQLEVPYSNNRMFVVSGSADCSSVNTPYPFANFQVATAESRAFGRSIKSLLRLNRIYTAEEIMQPNNDEPGVRDDRCPSSMLNTLIMMCASQKLDLKSLVKHLFQVESPEIITRKQGLQVAETISDYKKGVLELPQEIKN